MAPHGQFPAHQGQYHAHPHGVPEARRCARCTYPLSLVVHKSGAHVDHCYRCGGTFLDWGEAGPVIGEKADPRMWPRETFARPPAPTPLCCPAGHGNMWSYLLTWDGKSVEIDACGTCNGMWLDAHEAEQLEAITAHAHAESARPGASKGTIGVVAMYVLQLASALPVEVYNPVRRRPYVTISTVVLLAVLFVVEIAAVMIGGKDVIKVVALVPAYFERGYVHQIVTYAFLHGGIVHLVGNLYSLWIFGDNVEDRLGRGRYVVLYLVSAIAGGLAHWAIHMHSTEPMVGASGAIAGLMGAYLYLFPKVKLWVVFFFAQFKVRAFWYMLVWVALNFVIALSKASNVAWLAHVGGFVAGVVLAKLLEPKAAPPR